MTTKPAPYVTIKQRIDVTVRKRWVHDSKEQYPNKLPVVLEPNTPELLTGSIPVVQNPKFLFPIDFQCYQAASILRKKLDLHQTETILLFAHSGGRYNLVRPQCALADIYAKYADKEDGMLYLVYARENVFG